MKGKESSHKFLKLPARSLEKVGRHLSLSTNCIDKMISLPALKNIEAFCTKRAVLPRPWHKFQQMFLFLPKTEFCKVVIDP